MQNSAKRARQALAGPSLPPPSSLTGPSPSLRAPPTSGLGIGLPRRKSKVSKNSWVWEQYIKRLKSTAQAGSSSKGDSEDEEGDQEQQVEHLIIETSDPLPLDGSWQNEVQQQQQEQQQQGAVEFCCKHCNKVMSGKNEDRMKKHLINASVCTFLDSAAAAECTARMLMRMQVGTHS